MNTWRNVSFGVLFVALLFGAGEENASASDVNYCDVGGWGLGSTIICNPPQGCATLEYPDGYCDFGFGCGEALQTAVAECEYIELWFYGWNPPWQQETIVENFVCDPEQEEETLFSFQCSTAVYPCEPCPGQ